jgi:pimeloyl-ACP methyl ester carboxylesterase
VTGEAHLFGASSGGALALEAAAAGARVRSIAVFDVPYSVGPAAVESWQAYVKELHAALADHDRDLALELFMRVAGVPDEAIAEAKASPYWAPMRPLAHTLAYDAACLHDGSPPHQRLATIDQPVLVVTRSAPGPDTAFFAAAADAIAKSLAAVTRRTVGAPSHVVDADALGPALIDFFRSH